MHGTRFGIAAVLALAGLFASPARADDDETIDLSKVPAVVKKAAERAAPGVKWTRATRETENGQTIYELSGTDAEKIEIEVEVTAAGKVIEVETEVQLSEIPKAVIAAARAKYPTFTPTEGEKVVRDGKLYAHDLEGKLDKIG